MPRTLHDVIADLLAAHQREPVVDLGRVSALDNGAREKRNSRRSRCFFLS
ncbi:MAG TPA: hypothetical protein QGF58_09315 [Myxococcota bacterium]|nr:hypothetical protein [Myxococcota bacterium]